MMGEAMQDHNVGRIDLRRIDAARRGASRPAFALKSLPRLAFGALALAALAACSGGADRGRVGAPAARAPAQAAPAAPQPGEGGRVDLSAPARVALLAPLGASDAGAAAAARDIVDAARLALSEGASDAIQLDVRDTKGDAATAASAARGAVSEGDALILGPLYGAFAEDVGRAVAPQAVNVLAFSNTPSAGGGNVWVAGLLAGDEAERILAYAGRQGWRGVGLFYPETPLGRVARAGAEEAARRHGVSLTPVMPYPRSFEGIQTASQSFADAAKASGTTTALLADEGQGLQTAGGFMRYHYIGTGAAPLLGLGAMGEPSVARDSNFDGALFAGLDPAALADFAARFEAAYGRQPSKYAWLGYDLTAAAAQMMRAGRLRGDDRPFGLEEIADPAGFRGVAGPWRLTSDGLNMRALAVLTPGADGPQVVEPAQSSAGLPGS